MSEPTCRRHVEAYWRFGFDVWVVESDAGQIVGEVELWYAEEPEPFGRYGHIQLLELDGEAATHEVEDWIIDQAEARAQERGYRRFWCRPVGSGGSVPVLESRGYKLGWRNAAVRVLDLQTLVPPPHEISLLTGNYATEAAHLLALNHRESASYRWSYLWRSALEPHLAEFPQGPFSGFSVRFQSGGGGLCLVGVWPRSHSGHMQADLWVPPERAGDVDLVRGLLAVAAEEVLKLDPSTQVLDAYMSLPLGEAVVAGPIEPLVLEDGDPWYVKQLG